MEREKTETETERGAGERFLLDVVFGVWTLRKPHAGKLVRNCGLTAKKENSVWLWKRNPETDLKSNQMGTKVHIRNFKRALSSVLDICKSKMGRASFFLEPRRNS